MKKMLLTQETLQLTTKGWAFILGVENELFTEEDEVKFEKFWAEFAKILEKEKTNQFKRKPHNPRNEGPANGKPPFVYILLCAIVGSLIGKSLIMILKVCGIL